MNLVDEFRKGADPTRLVSYATDHAFQRNQPNALLDLFENNQGSSTGPQGTLLGMLKPDLKTTVSANPVSQHVVSAGQNNAMNAVQPAQAALSSMQGAIAGTKAAISDAVKQMQSEITNITQALGQNPSQLFPHTDMGSESGVLLDIGIAVASNGLTAGGAGSFVTAAQSANAASTYEDIVGDRMAGSSQRSAVMGEVMDKLRVSTSPQTDTRSSFEGNKSPVMSVGLAWQNMPDNMDSEVLQAIMKEDPENPSEAFFPEYAALEHQGAQIKTAMAQNITTENRLETDPTQAPDFVENLLVGLVSVEALKDINGLEVLELPTFESAQEAGEKLAAAHQNEPDLIQLGVGPDTSMTPAKPNTAA